MSEGKAFRCGECGVDPVWRIERQGDAVVDWACVDHLNEVCADLLRSWERVTTLIVRGRPGDER
jgi:hypothetical protein